MPSPTTSSCSLRSPTACGCEQPSGPTPQAWAGELGQEIDRTALAVESNVLRFRPLPAVTVRAGHGGSPVELVRVLLAAELAGTPARVSLDPAVASTLGLLDAPMDGSALAAVRRLHRVVDAVESVEEFVARVRSGVVSGRVRVVGDEGGGLLRELAGDEVTVADRTGACRRSTASCSRCCASRRSRARATASATSRRSPSHEVSASLRRRNFMRSGGEAQ